jgi:metal-responsive CopG/Arc/MetJ family transcriptional regulator
MNNIKKTTKLVIDVDKELKDTFKKLSKLEDMDQSKIVRKWIKDYVEKNKDKLNKLF